MTAPAHGFERLPRLRWQQWLLLALALAVIVLLRKHMSEWEDRVAPIAVHGAVGQRLQGRNFAAQVNGVSVARALKTPAGLGRDGPIRLDSSGVWLVVAAKLEALEEPGWVSARVRTADGLLYRAVADRRVAGTILGRQVVPGLPEGGDYFVELPPDRLEGAHLELSWGMSGPKSFDSLLDIDLGIDAAAARRLLAAAEPERETGP